MSRDDPERRVIGRYHLRHRLGQGGMGSVYLASAQGPGGFEKLVALKVLGAVLGNDESFVRMFLDEARLSARIAHPNVCTVFDFGESEGTYYLAMEHLLGEPLTVVAEAHPPYELVVRMIADAARGLHAAHELADESGSPVGVVHRDVSPQNVVVLYDGVTKVVDFGIAKARDRLTETASGALKGKISYMAPEQLEGAETDRRTDVFSLGVVLWETSLGWPLFKRAKQAATIKAVLHDPLLLPSQVQEDYPPCLEAVVARALDRVPARRFPTMEAMADALEDCIATMARPAGAAQVSQWMRRQFADRLASRTSLLRLAPDGGMADRPGAPADAQQASARTPPTAGRPSAPPRGVPRRPLAIAALVAALAISAGVGAWLASPRSGDSIAARPRRGAVLGKAARGRSPHAVTPATDAGGGAAVTAGSETDGSFRGDAGAVTIASTARSHAVAAREQGAPVPRPPREPGFANVVCFPAAEVYAGARHLGATPLRRVQLEPGRHLLELRVPDRGLSKRVSVLVRSGEVSFVSVRLEP